MSKKIFSKRYNKDDNKKTTPEIEKNADELANEDADGVVVINMGPRNHRDRYANLRQNAETDTITINPSDSDNLAIPADKASTLTVNDDEYKPTDIWTKVDGLNDEIEKVSMDVSALINSNEVSYKVLTDKYDSLAESIEKAALADSVSEKFDEVIGSINCLSETQKNELIKVSEKQVNADLDRKESEELIRKSIESLSENLRSTSEGFDYYKDSHDLKHTEIDSKLSSLQGSVDRMNPDSIYANIKDNRSFTEKVRETAKDCIDSLIRVTRMLEITFISIIAAFIFLMIKTSIPNTNIVAQAIFGVLSILCIVFIFVESKYAFKYIRFAAESMKKLE